MAGPVRSGLALLRDLGAGRDAAMEEIRERLIHAEGAARELVGLLVEVSDDEDDATSDIALAMLSGALSAARTAEENDQEGGRRFLDEAEAAVGALDDAGGLSPAARVILGSAYVRAGLAAPDALVLADPEDWEAGLVGSPDLHLLVDQALLAADEDAGAAHGHLCEMMGAMPAGLRTAIVAGIAGRGSGRGLRMAGYFLLDPDPAVRCAAASGLGGRARSGQLDAVTAATMATVLPWLPDDAARAALAVAVGSAGRRGAAGGAEPPRWKVTRTLATLPDGVGASTLAVVAQAPKRRAVAMLLLKEGHGVREAYLVPCPRASDQRAMIERLEAEVDALRVGAGFVVEELARAVADGLAAGVPPAPGLIDVAEILGVAIEPRRWTVAEMIAPFEVAARSAKAIVGAVETSGIWVDTYAMVETWFENSSESRAIVDANADDEEAALGALRGYLAGRGDWWGRLFAVAARALGAAGHPAARDFASVADLVVAGTPLDRLPIGRAIVERTLDARLDALDAIEASDEDEDELEEEDGWRGPGAGDAEALDAALAARGLGVAWVDGFMTAAIVAPTVPAFAHLMASVLQRLELATIADMQALLDALTTRGNAIAEDALDPATFAARMAAVPAEERADWARGFTESVRLAGAAWRGKSVKKADNAMLTRIGAAGRGGDAAGLWPDLVPWLIARRPR